MLSGPRGDPASLPLVFPRTGVCWLVPSVRISGGVMSWQKVQPIMQAAGGGVGRLGRVVGAGKGESYPSGLSGCRRRGCRTAAYRKDWRRRTTLLPIPHDESASTCAQRPIKTRGWALWYGSIAQAAVSKLLQWTILRCLGHNGISLTHLAGGLRRTEALTEGRGSVNA
jgi:hypothetical protein